MVLYCFRKIKTVTREEYILVFEHGEIQKPIMALSKSNMEDIINEWKKDAN